MKTFGQLRQKINRSIHRKNKAKERLAYGDIRVSKGGSGKKKRPKGLQQGAEVSGEGDQQGGEVDSKGSKA